MIDWAYYQKTWRTCCGYQGYHRGQILFSRPLARGWMSQSHFQLMLLATFLGHSVFSRPTTAIKVSAFTWSSWHPFINSWTSNSPELSASIFVNISSEKKTFSCLNDDNDGNHNDNNLGGDGGGDLFWKCLLFHKDPHVAWLPRRPAYYTQTARRVQHTRLNKIIQN